MEFFIFGLLGVVKVSRVQFSFDSIFMAKSLIDEAVDIVNSFGKESKILVKLTRLIINRTY